MHPFMSYIVFIFFTSFLCYSANAECLYPLDVDHAIDHIQQRSKNHYQDAASILQSTERSMADRGWHDTCRAKILYNLGLVLGQLEEIDLLEEVDYYKEALSLRSLHTDPYSYQNIKLLTNISSCYSILKKRDSVYTESYIDSMLLYLRLARQKETERQERGMPYSDQYAYISHNLAKYYHGMGDLNKAKLNYNTAAHFHRNDPRRLVKVLNDLSGLYSTEYKDGQQALLYVDSALQIREADEKIRIKLTFNKALAFKVLSEGKDASEAKPLLEEAKAWYLKANELGYPYKDEIQNNIAVIENRLGNYEAALALLLKAEAFNRENGYLHYLAQNLDNKGDALLGLECYQEALKSYNESLKYTFSGFKAKDSFDLPDLNQHIAYDRIGGLITLASKAELLATLFKENGDINYLEASIGHYNFIDQYLHKIRKSFVAEGSKFSLAQTAKPIYEKAISACLLMARADGPPEDWYERAFYFAEQSKATILLEYMNEQVAARLALDSTAQEQLFQAMRKRDWTETQLASKIIKQAEEKEIQQYREELLFYQDEVERLEQQMQERHPEYVRLAAKRSPLTLEEIQKKVLVKGQGIVEYFVGKEESYAFIINSDQIRLETLPAAGDLQPIIDGTVQGLKGFNTDYERARDQYIKYAQLLYDSIIAPLGALSSHLVIVPDDYLLYVPFEALLSGAVESPGNFRNYPYWIMEKTISYSFSVALLEEMKNGKGRKKAGQFWAGFSPVFPKEHFSGQGVETLNQSHGFIEAFANEHNWEQQLWPYEKASAGNFKTHAPEYRILHLASHTSIEETEPLLSYIRFWGDSIFLKDLYTIPLNAELVVLHSCLTNAGRLYKGEGIASINRGVVSAGARSVLTTLWPIKDGQSPEFMQPFYNDFLLKGMAKDKSVREAKLEVIKMGTLSPYAWAGYTLYGDTAPVVSKGISWLWILLCTILLLLLLFFGRKRGRLNEE